LTPVPLPDSQKLIDWSGALTGAGLRAAIAIGVALAIHFILFRVAQRLARRSDTESDDILADRLANPARWLLMAVALGIAQEGSPVLAPLWTQGARFAVPLLMGWVAFSLVDAFATILDLRAERYDDEIAARSRRTRVAILSRSARFVIMVLTIALVLSNIPGVRNIGVTLMASAGFAGLVLGVAAQPALKSLFAGIQIALTEPIRLGDYVVIDGESGRVEDIRLSFVIVRTADERRLIVPTSKFLDASFQNWTRMGGGLIGSVLLPVRPGHPIQPIRTAYATLLAAQADWDGKTSALQVADARVGSVDLKLVMSASGPSELARLRNAMREAMLEWLREEMPEALCPDPA